MNSQMTLGLLVVGSVGDNPPKNFNAWTLDLPSLKDLRGLGVIFHDPLGGIHLPNTSQKILKNHYFGDTPYSSEFSGVFLMAIQQKNLKTVFSYNLHSMGILELLVEFLLYISWTWKILKHKTSWKYPLQTTSAWPSHSWFTDMYGGHPANWKSKCLRASIWQCVMFPQLLRQRSMYIPLLLLAMLLRWLWCLVGWGSLFTLSISKSKRKFWIILVLVGWCIPFIRHRKNF